MEMERGEGGCSLGEKIQNEEFLEHAIVFNNKYGKDLVFSNIL